MSQRTSHAAHPDLQADCGDCFGLCCVALPFSRSADFPVNKSAGTPCGNLQKDFGCGIHEQLRDRGYNGCAVFDCFGAGQKVSRVTFTSVSWRDEPASARAMFEVLPIMRRLHELLTYTAQALDLPSARPVHQELRRAYEQIDALTRETPQTVLDVDIDALRATVAPLLLRTAELARAAVPASGRNHRRADLAGARLHGAQLRGADLRGALLIAADLSGADPRDADLIGADVRDADLSGADLRNALFLTRSQLDSARGDARTRISPPLQHPPHWAT
ncbi:pentapeptide repeat-containing protein [Streptomyces bohaiensis]|uniref:Pentapeptide repeat-containing protein n=1 Tax=Streptomyces bohaiensis TaxID=1431344 RepID=A0ABX1C303_9ACTN|nr:pentapeptide repeat-containing protein [Streptomyces bohaiensis]NJQ13622.1 pentapeptide repeat-containing protein [Streptomyces bohaiensis]